MKLELLHQNVNMDNRIVTGNALDLVTYENKFKMWDYVMEHNLLQCEDNAIQWRALNLLNDDTIYSYNYFKTDEGAPFRNTAYQDLMGNLKHDFSPMGINRYILYVAANQCGKSRFLINKSIKITFTEQNRNIVLVSKNLDMSKFLLSELKKTLNNSGFSNTWKEDRGDTDNTTILTFTKDVLNPDGTVKYTYLNRIICTPCTEGILGYPVHYLFLDEADFYEDAKVFFHGPAKNRTNKTKGQIILFSNPNFKISRVNSLLWELMNGTKFKRKFKFTFLDAPWNTKEEYDDDKLNTPQYIFKSTHDGEFSDSGGAFLKDAEIKDMLQKDWDNDRLPVFDVPVIIAMDLGKMNDQTVLGIGISKDPKDSRDKKPDIDIRYTEEFELGTEYKDIVNRYKQIRDHYTEFGVGVQDFLYDSTGQKTFVELLDLMDVAGTGVDFSKKESNKTQLYNDFKLMAENRKLRVVYSRKMEKQLAGLEFKLTPNKQMKKVENKTDSIHDDYADMCAILIHGAVFPSAIIPGVTVL